MGELIFRALNKTAARPDSCVARCGGASLPTIRVCSGPSSFTPCSWSVRNVWLVPLIALSCLMSTNCDQAPAESGLRSWLRVQGGQFFPEPMPPAGDGIAINSIGTVSSMVRAGRGTALSGLVPKETQAIAVSLVGDNGYWIFQPGVIDPIHPDQLSFETKIYFSPDIPSGPQEILASTVNNEGVLGPTNTLKLEITAEELIKGPLVVSLWWSSEADLDLHVAQPDGTEIWFGNINAYHPPPPGELPDPLAAAESAYLDFDSNKQCSIDGRRRENIIWPKTPPSGHYLVRVDTFSLCAEVGSQWIVQVQHNEEVIQQAQGIARLEDTRMKHGEGQGVLAVDFDIP